VIQLLHTRQKIHLFTVYFALLVNNGDDDDDDINDNSNSNKQDLISCTLAMSCDTAAIGPGRSRSCMSLNSYTNVMSDSTSGYDGHFRFRPSDGRVTRFTQSSEDEDDDEEECEDVVVQLPTWTPTPVPRQQRSLSFPRRWNPAGGGLRRAVGRLSATSRLLGRRSVPSSWDGRRALEQALLFAAVVPLKASTDAGLATATTSTVAVDLPADADHDQQSQSVSTQNSEVTAENDSIFLA